MQCFTPELVSSSCVICCCCCIQTAALSLEVSELKRSEVKLSAEVTMLQQQLAQTQQQLEEAR